MPRDPRAFLWDARQAIAHLRSFIEGKTWDDTTRLDPLDETLASLVDDPDLGPAD